MSKRRQKLFQSNMNQWRGFRDCLQAFAVGLAMLLVAPGAQAQNVQPGSDNNDAPIDQPDHNDIPVIAVNRQIAIFGSGMYQDYKETLKYLDINGYTPDTENGWVPGFGVRGAVLQDVGFIDNLFANAEYEYDNGTTAYSGHYLYFPNIPYHGPSSETIQDSRVEVGKGFLLYDQALLIPILQAEYRTWDRGLAGSTEHYSYSAIGVGVRGDFTVNDRWVLTSKLGLEYMVDGQMQSDSTTFHLGTNSIFQAAAGVDYRMTRLIHVFGEADYSGFDFGHSQVADGLQEPTSHTNDLSLKLGLGLKF